MSFIDMTKYVSDDCTIDAQAMEDRPGSRTEQLASAEVRAADAETRHSLCRQDRDEARQRFDNITLRLPYPFYPLIFCKSCLSFL